MADSTSRTGQQNYATPALLDYLHRTHVAHDSALADAFTVPEGVPAIQVGPQEGKLLGLLLRMIGAVKVVEVGTLVGYSAIHIARALPPTGRLWSVEYEPRHAELAHANLTAAGLADRVAIVVGAGRAVLPTLADQAPFDAVFIDADKQSYDFYGQWAVTHLRPGGLVIGDNAYLFGNLLADTDAGRAMRGFHEHVAATCDSVCIPTPDGLVVGIKR